MEFGYSAIHPVVRQVLKMTFMEVPLAGRLLLWLTPALVGGCNLSLNMHQNIANDWMNNAVQRSAKRRGCLLSYSQAEPGRELTQPRKHLLAEPCSHK